MSEKKQNFLKEVLSYGCAVLVGPMLEKSEISFSENAPLLLVDGGYDKCSEHSLLANRSYYSVGDGDSSASHLDEKLPCEKDYSDLSFALDFLPTSINKLELFGFLGGRKDHEISNFGEVQRFLAHKTLKTHARFSNEILALSPGSWSLEHHGVFSLMAIETATVELSGNVKYKIELPTELSPLSSLGLSNLAKGEFHLETSTPLFIYGSGVKVSSE